MLGASQRQVCLSLVCRGLRVDKLAAVREENDTH